MIDTTYAYHTTTYEVIGSSDYVLIEIHTSYSFKKFFFLFFCVLVLN